MADESIEKTEQPPAPTIVKRFSAKIEGDKIRLTWHILQAGNVEISGVGEVGSSGSILAEPRTSYTLSVDGQQARRVDMVLPGEEGTEEGISTASESAEDGQPKRIPCGDGFLIVDGKETSNTEMAHASDGPGKCPKCGVAANAWIPPVDNPAFQKLVTDLKKNHDLKDDAQAHGLHLRQTGGFIAECSECQTTFFVPSSVAKIKAE